MFSDILARARARNPTLEMAPFLGYVGGCDPTTDLKDDAMERFLARYRPLITAVLSGFDRLVFRGTLIPLVRPGGMYTFLTRAQIALLDFKPYVLATSERVKAAALREALEHDRPIRYLESSTIDKEALARRLLAEHPVDQGLICAFKTVEPCMSFEYHRSSDPHERGLRLRPRKCLHVYKYYWHRVFGFLSARLQTWFPFAIQICLNGREWLAAHLQRQGVEFRRHDNAFTWLGDPARAQRLMDHQLTVAWPRALDALARALHPLHAEIFRPWPQSYYWSTYQSEWATDLLFTDPRALARVYPALVRHATLHFQSPDVMRFLGRQVHGNFAGELVSRCTARPEGVRVKHWVNGNSITMDDKAGSILRVETTVGKATDFKVFRPLHHQPRGCRAWRPLRKGVADLHRRAQVSQRSNEHYLDALAAVDDGTPLHRLLDQVGRRTAYRGRPVRALRTGDPADLALLRAVARGEWATAGFRNRDLRRLLYSPLPTASPLEAQRLTAKVTRQLRLLRAHGLIQRIPKTHRYRLTPKGQLLTAAVFAARDATLKQLIGTVA